MKTYAEADDYERLFMTTPPDDDPWWCSSQSVLGWKNNYILCGYSQEELQAILEQHLDGTIQPIHACELPLRIAALRELLGQTETDETGTICPKCLARQQRKQASIDTAQTTLF